MTIVGYGEDGLTYWALTTRLQDILKQLDDRTSPEQCTVYFRPSFGRSGGPKSSQFGEFDAILATPKAVYLIESKWDNVANSTGPVVLREVQLLRHRIFTWLCNRWQPGQNWDAFHRPAESDFALAFPNRPLAPLGSLLARNLYYILDQLRVNFPKSSPRNVLLYFHRDNVQRPDRVVNATGQVVDSFTLVCLPYAALGQSGYFQMVQ